MGELFVPTVNFAMLVGLLGYFAWPVFKKSVSERRDTIKKHTDEARLQKLDAEKKYRELESKIKTFEADAQALLKSTEADTLRLKEKIILDAQKSAEWIRKDAEGAVAATLNEFKDELRYKVIAAAVAEAQSLVQKQLSKDVQSRIIRDYVEKVQ